MALKDASGTRGAVLAEFVIAIVPVLMMTFGWLQLAWIYTANLLVKRAATSCVRAAAVIDNPYSLNPGKPGKPEEMQVAADRAANVEPNKKTFSSVRCEIDNEATVDDPFGKVTATVTAEYDCSVPMGKFIICGPSAKKTLKKTSSMPFQGARYADE